jgi:hypothetical protein
MEKPQGNEYGGPSGIGRDSNWLTAEDLIEGRDVKVVIEKVIHYPELTFEMGRKEKNKLALEFKGKERALVLNATNRKTLNAMFGSVTKAWWGKEVTLFVTQTQMKGETVNCVRIRKGKARAATVAEDLLGGADAEPVASVPPVEGNGAAPGTTDRGDAYEGEPPAARAS